MDFETILLKPDGSIKSLNPGDPYDHPEAWTNLGATFTTDLERRARKYFSKVPWLWRGANLIATELSGLPFEIFEGDSDKPVDDSMNYKNVVDFLPHPERIFYLLELCQQMIGRGYLFKHRNRFDYTRGVQYVLPTSVKPKWKKGGASIVLAAWERTFTVGEGTTQTVTMPIEDFFYSWYPDMWTEIGPPDDYPAKRALAAAGVLSGIDDFLDGFFERGAVATTVMTVAKTTSAKERKRLENYFTRTLTGIANAFRVKVFNADVLKPVKIGEGLEALEESQLSKTKREDIAAAFGIPMSKLFSTEAGGLGGEGVVSQDDHRFTKEVLLPRARYLYADLNEQLFGPAGYRIQVNERAIDALQEDERERSFAVVNYTSAFNTNPKAAKLSVNLLGVEMDEETTALLEELITDKEEQARQMQERLANMPQIGSGQQNGQARLQPQQEPGAQGKSLEEVQLQNERLREIGQWQRHASNHGAERSAVEFKPEYLGRSVTKFIRAALAVSKGSANTKSIMNAARQMVEEERQLSPAMIGAMRSALENAPNSASVEYVLRELQTWDSYP